MEIIESNKGKDKLAFNGYMYVTKHAGKNYYMWRSILHTSINKTDPILKVKHEHPAEQSKIEIAKGINKIKQTAKCSGVNPSQIYAEGVSQLDVTTKARMPIKNSLKRTIRNYRKKENPIDPASLEKLQILNKTLATYEMMITTLLKKCEEQNLYPDPAVLHVDFERAVITAIIHVLSQHVGTYSGLFLPFDIINLSEITPVSDYEASISNCTSAAEAVAESFCFEVSMTIIGAFEKKVEGLNIGFCILFS
ncbi:hypothetical protein QTP88_027490 [Uroleucon formosanum]